MAQAFKPLATFNRLDALSRYRRLSLNESLLLERAIRGLERRRGRPPSWTPAEDYKAQALREQGWTYSLISTRVHRSCHAVAARLRLLSMKDARQ